MMNSSQMFLVITILTFTLASVFTEECGQYEQFLECGAKNELTCAVRNIPVDPNDCVAGCFCKPGFLREFEGGTCVTRKECPSFV
ncbi:chymotrypsin inhibitor-like [Anopheles funestus]|uniref:chymotrypsin inhibitor-like n=1 Tax=Anopheles funestus TaxID=62324 RepID=UPI0020C5C018|nr:chymotrypsin inhibitor-like [Anopheles funestus]